MPCYKFGENLSKELTKMLVQASFGASVLEEGIFAICLWIL